MAAKDKEARKAAVFMALVHHSEGMTVKELEAATDVVSWPEIEKKGGKHRG